MFYASICTLQKLSMAGEKGHREATRRLVLYREIL